MMYDVDNLTERQMNFEMMEKFGTGFVSSSGYHLRTEISNRPADGPRGFETGMRGEPSRFWLQ